MTRFEFPLQPFTGVFGALQPPPDDFDVFWASYPKRKGGNPRKPALKAWKAALKTGKVCAEDIIAAVKRFAHEERESIGTPYIPHARTWLSQERWEAYPAPTPQTAPTGVWVAMDTPQWEAWQKHLILSRGKGSPCVNFGWRFPTPWPPETEPQRGADHDANQQSNPEFSGHVDLPLDSPVTLT